MKNKSLLKSVVVLTAICLITAAILSAINYITAPYIQKAEYEKEQAALRRVLPSGEEFTPLELSELSLDKKIKAVYTEQGGGYAFKISVKGYKAGMVILCGIGADGTVCGAECLSSAETLEKEKTFGLNFVGRTAGDVMSVDTVSGATKTTAAYRNAIKMALEAFETLTKEGEK